MHRLLDADLIRRALEALDSAIGERAHLVVGGGAAMVLAYDHPLATQDVDAFPVQGSLGLGALDAAARVVAKALGIAPDWLNSHFDTFTAVLPADYGARLRTVFTGEYLRLDVLGPEDLLVMKCFAGRDKDLPHARRLLHIIDDIGVVDRQLGALAERSYPGADKAADFFDDLRDMEGV